MLALLCLLPSSPPALARYKPDSWVCTTGHRPSQRLTGELASAILTPRPSSPMALSAKRPQIYSLIDRVVVLSLPTSSYTTSTLEAASDAVPSFSRDFLYVDPGGADACATTLPGDEVRFLLPFGAIARCLDARCCGKGGGVGRWCSVMFRMWM